MDMADKRISQLVDRGTVANNDVVPIVVSGATTTNKATISSIQTFMQGNLDLGVTSVGITLGSSGTDVSVSGSPITSSGNITINLPTASATNRGLLSAADWVTFNSKQDAGSFVTLDTTQTITAQKTFTTSGSSDTMIISHGSGSGFALDVLKAGNGEAIRVTKTSGSGNAMTISGGNFEAGTIVKTGGTSSQFLKADGSIDSTAYTTNTGTVTSVSGTGTVSGLSLSGTVTTSGNLTLGGTLSLTSANVTDALGFTPYNATNPAGYTTNVGTVTSVAALTLGTSGTDLSSTVANGTTTPVITLNVPTASATNRGALSSADWTTFNNKQNALTNPITGTGATGQVAYWNGNNSQTGSNNLFWDNANIKLGIGTNTPESTGLTIAGGGIIVSLDSGAARKVLELYANSTGAKVSSTYVGASSYGSLELLTSNEARLTITAAGEATFSGLNLTLNNTGATGSDPLLTIQSLGGGNPRLKFLGQAGIINRGAAGDTLFFGETTDTGQYIFRGTGAATFSSSVTANGNSNTFGNASLSGRAVIIQAGSTNQAIMFKNSAGGDGTLFINGTSTTVDYNFNTYSVADALVIKNNGSIGIGIASPLQPAAGRRVLGINGDAAGSAIFNMTVDGVLKTFLYTDTNNTLLEGSGTTITLNASGSNNITFQTTDIERMRITSDAYLRMAASSGGIQFNGDTAAANALDDYEEGTWTPVIGGSGGESGQSYGGQTGYYTKVGRLVTATFRVVLSNKGTITGSAAIKGLPFTISATVSHGSGVTYFENLSTSWSYIFFMATGGETYATIDGIKSAAILTTRATTSDIGNSTQFNGSITYFA